MMRSLISGAGRTLRGLAAGAGLIAGLAAAAAQAAPDRRVALVIGNSDYQSVTRLENPLTDSKAIAASLKRIGFEVVEGYDLKLDGMRQAVGEYAAKLDGAKVALVYYAGHGVAVAGENYLLPTDTVLKSEADLDFRTLNMSLVLRQMQREDRVNVVILDACRDNPFAKELARSVGRTRSALVGSGLSEIQVGSAAGTMIAFSTDPGKTALDGNAGQNSPFTTALLKHMESPGVSISTVMDRVRQDVWRATGERQRPWVNTSIIGEFYLNPAAPVQVASAGLDGSIPAVPSAAAPAPGPQALEMRLFEAADRSGAAEDYKAYLEAYPNGTFAQIARNRIARASATAAPAAGRSAVSEADLKAGAGSAATEAELKLGPKDRVEVQQRLKALGFDPGGASGQFGPGTRRALANWQKTRQAPDTGFLTAGQREALREQSEADYRKLLAARPPVERTVRPAAPRPARTQEAADALPPRQAPAQAARPAPAQAVRPAPQGGGASLGEVGNFLGGVGSLVGGIGSLRR